MNVRTLPFLAVTPAQFGIELAVDPDLDPGRAALDLDDEVHALVGDRDVAGERRRSCSRAPVAVTMIDQRPVVSWSGVLNVPSSATGTVDRAPAAGRRAGAAARRPVRRRAGRRSVAVTETLVAFVVVPWTGIAPFSTVAPSAGWSTVSVGTSMSANGTVMTTWAVSSDCLPVSGRSPRS